jgi:hypothetical protein
LQSILTKAAATTQLKPTQFRSGSDGFRGQGKVVEGEDRYQVQVIATRIGSKPEAKKSGKK